MKKVFLTLACVAFLAAITTSCVKSCYCTVEGSDEMFAGEMTSAQCNSYETTQAALGLTIECDAR
jgi:hypothetical protein